MEEKVTATAESDVLAPPREGGEVKEGRVGQGSPLGDALILKISLAVSRPIDFILPDVQGD